VRAVEGGSSIREPYLWSWDAAAPALALPVPSLSDALLLAMVRDYLGPMLPPQMLDALRPYLDREEIGSEHTYSQAGSSSWVNV